MRIIHPKKSFFKLIEEKGFPSRLRRFCCEELKERYGIGKRSIEGMRAAESRNRKDYEPEQCDTRKWMKGAKHILPILTWTEEDVWNYIRERGLPYSKYYDAPYNLSRHGCVGCPLCNSRQMQLEFKMFPGYARRMIVAVERYMSAHPNGFLARNFETVMRHSITISMKSLLQIFASKGKGCLNSMHKKLFEEKF